MAVQPGMYTDILVDIIGKAIRGGENFGTMKMLAPLTKEEEEARRAQNELRHPELRERQPLHQLRHRHHNTYHLHHWNHNYNYHKSLR